MSLAPIRLSELLDEIHEVIDGHFYGDTRRVLVEVSDVKNYLQRFYCFFRVVEKSGSEIIAQAEAVIWRNEYATIKDFERQTGIRFSQDMEVVVEAFVTFHPKWGLKLQVVAIDPGFTIGKIELERRKTIERLCKDFPDWVWKDGEELVSLNQTLELKDTLKRVALISAPDSDGRRDFLHELSHNAYGITYDVVTFDAAVQGSAASAQISDCLDQIAPYHSHFDALALVRGGGGNTDLAAFDDFELSKRIAGCNIPVFTGIGHERNVSIADLVAHSPMKTPTKCASALSEHNAYALGYLEEMERKVIQLAQTRIQKEKNQLDKIWTGVFPFLQKKIMAERLMLEKLNTRLAILDPTQYLKNGLALVFQEGKRIRKIQDINETLPLQIKMQGGGLTLKVVNNGEENN